MNNLKISARLLVLITALLLAVLIIGFTGYLGLNQANNAFNNAAQAVEDQKASADLTHVIAIEFTDLIHNTNLGLISWAQAVKNLSDLRVEYDAAWEKYLKQIPVGAQKEEVLSAKESMDSTFAEATTLMQAQDRTKFNLFVANSLASAVEPVHGKILHPREQKMAGDTVSAMQKAIQTSRNFSAIMIVIGLLAALMAVGLGVVTYNSIAKPVEKIATTVQQVAEGDFSVRTDLTGTDELADLGRGFDRLLNERVSTLVEAEQANDNLNSSIILLLQAVSQLSQRDLTVKVPVNEDVTGPMADALNLLTTETAKVLGEVTQLSEEVANASGQVKSQADAVMAVASDERQEVERAATELAAAATDMNHIAVLANECNQTAAHAIETTGKALETVVSTVNGITSTRDTIRETEKRIKRLGERSQEISGVVNLINTIAERTHILALNASMHAASAGEAGRGFAVVADEVQRLAENAREATSQIATLVSSIQVETADTASAMNQAISQVVEGSRLAEQAGEQMRKTQQTTADLVSSVQQIAVRSQEQARVSNALLERARQIQSSTVQTGQRLVEQSQYTNNLVDFAGSLLTSVRVFKLPVQGV
ncbi:MAG: methyl-accepting chemotaxis protein [Candidatus Competibacter denitrificans]|jgi:methyl-accepting chemotaxis protein